MVDIFWNYKNEFVFRDCKSYLEHNGGTCLKKPPLLVPPSKRMKPPPAIARDGTFRSGI
jgi:hypothetical protein